MVISRRDFVCLAGSVVALATLGGAARLLPGDASLLRPPGALDSEAFFARCTRCDRCRSACPTQAIAPAVLEDGFLAVRSPKLNFKLGWCNFCGECTRVCPTGALTPFSGEAFAFTAPASAAAPVAAASAAAAPVAAASAAGAPVAAASTTTSVAGVPGGVFFHTEQIIGLAHVKREHCIAWTGPSSCTICLQKCPYEAIGADAAGRPVVDAARCNGCGVCEHFCPSSTLRSYAGGRTRGIEVEPLSLTPIEGEV